MKRMTFLGIVLSIVVLAGVSYGNDGIRIVDVDIRPESCPNPLNLKSKGVISVAILGTDIFDVRDIDLATIELEGVPPLRYSDEDVATAFADSECDCNEYGSDGYQDLVLKFNSQEVASALGNSFTSGDSISLLLTGQLVDGSNIAGEDCVVIIGPYN